MRIHAHAVVLATIAFALLSTPSAADVTKLECVNANARAQDLRREGRLAAARLQLEACVVPACPRLVRDDCGKQMEELDRVQPTVIFEVKDVNGSDAVSAFVSVDGSVASPLTGRPLAVDPGSHVFNFTAGPVSATKTLLLNEGDRRRERVVLDAAPSLALPLDQGPETSRRMGMRETVAFAVGAIGLTSVVVGGVLGGVAISEVSKEKSACSPGACPDRAGGISDRSSAETAAAASTTMFIAGGALVATGLLLFFRPHPTARTSLELTLMPNFVTGGGALVWKGTF